jgi:hypothetical protein
MAERYDVFGTPRRPGIFKGKELSHTCTTRLLILPERLESKLKVTLVHQRKGSSGEWRNEPSPRLSSLKAGEAKKFILDYNQTHNLMKELENLYAIVEQTRLTPGASHLVVAPESEVVIADRNRAQAIRSMLAKGYPDDVWQALVRADPDLATKLSYARIHSERALALGEFERHLRLRESEAWWEQFFKGNTWIFGYGLNYRFLKTVQSQPRYGGMAVTGKGTQTGDFLQRTEAETKFTVLVEIKKPDTDLLGNEEYRNGAHQLGKHLTGGVSQLQANCRKWEKEGSESEENKEAFLDERIFTVLPKGILVIGHTNQLDAPSKRNTFELFRRNVVNPEIITFDELYERAKFIVDSTKETCSEELDATSFTDDDVPF